VTYPVSILLPGLDGTGDLFGTFVAAAPSDLPVRVQPLPSDQPRSYRDLVETLLPLLPTEPFALIAESFSGPLAILLANRCPRACAVVLCATFIRLPLPQLLARLPALFWRKPPPQLLLQLVMTGGDRRLALAVQDSVAQLDGAIVRARVAAALTIDVTQELQRLAQPLLFLRADRDRLIPAGCAAAVRAAKPSVRISNIDGPHLILQARPDESWRLIAPFLERAFLGAAGLVELRSWPVKLR
jgi:pimeloyl-ACP methyl ester carboxylesterase